ncbi:MAG: hypothetical protein EKK63_02510 [Acinetobacter sp.]|uniref:hypothetical protein n=1 Tax=Acinetobacter sp. TaxID=472 RepID=UPI000FAA9731|nr:hypothetical protein [Acinetobacter sp.]RUP42189.1 MAG: hypothetical protein EKK63_02510 [Acinetobacter sp.]
MGKYKDEETMLKTLEISLEEFRWRMAKDFMYKKFGYKIANALFNQVSHAKGMNIGNVTKQLCNRLLEPFMWHTVLITSTDDGWNNFFNLRNPVYEIDLDNLESLRG